MDVGMSTPPCKPGNLEDVADEDDDGNDGNDDNDNDIDYDNDDVNGDANKNVNGNDNDNDDDQAGVDDLEVLQAALLHDTVEDTDTSLQVAISDDDAVLVLSLIVLRTLTDTTLQVMQAMRCWW